VVILKYRVLTRIIYVTIQIDFFMSDEDLNFSTWLANWRAYSVLKYFS